MLGAVKHAARSHLARYNNLVHKICAQTRSGFDLPWDFAGHREQERSWFASGQLCFMEYTRDLSITKSRLATTRCHTGAGWYRFKLKMVNGNIGELVDRRTGY